ncbi:MULTISPECIES: hydantoinase/oxoprolinase family protein [Prauserella salsuginis group]|uniref:Hydantoinase/oxoprolinase family protein n=1 Tax=Prauserella salsuginis TaxID=387889 RepID=A0ABW6G1A2_9PSEU|nr:MULTISPECIES: hydantoinase/oxoprolinase family protein [Prauserella salsuginis group]MCR3722114.1 N-methylhydantoinase A [Prauserella flava]MCR3736111.1 N-methylhydantoinase A [Prauserella salsuginis]
MTYRVAMDIGGTFTDVVSCDETSGHMQAGKVLTTPDDLARGVFDALERLRLPLSQVGFFVHGTTQGLNALLERRGADVLIMTSEGIGDVYRIARGNRSRLFDLHYRKQTPLVPRDDIVEVGGRFDASGAELEPLDEDAVRLVAKRVREEGFDAVAVCLLFSFLDGSHEERAGRILREELGDEALVVLSHEVAPEWREYERTSTTVLEAYTGPSVHRYLDEIEDRFSEKGMDVPVHVMQSSGGLVNADFARRHPLQTLLSGPVGGTMGGVAVSRLLDRPNVICIDMGGTSFDVSLVLDHRPDVSPDGEVEGFPLLMPLVNLHTVGAGGGSLAYAEGGALRVGPESAGAVPGPACYGRGGTRPTVTDANCVLGRVDPESFAGGMRLDVAAARDAVATLADHLGMDAVELASGICDVGNAKMAQAIRTLTVEHGREPGQFALLAFGGAGPMHAAFIAQEIGVTEVVVPRFPGAFSAWGMLEADVRRDFSMQFFATGADLDTAALDTALRTLHDQASNALAEQGIEAERRQVGHGIDMRYESQDYTLTVPLSEADDVTAPGFLADIEQRFAEEHEKRYGHATPGAPVQFVALRTTGHGLVERVDAQYGAAAAETSEPVVRDVVFDGAPWPTTIVPRAALPIGAELSGPAIVHEETSTTVVPPGARLRVDDNEFLIMTLAARPELEAHA